MIDKQDDGPVPARRKEKGGSKEERAFDKMVDDIQLAVTRKEEEIYSEQVLTEAKAPENMGFLKEPDATGGTRGPCGDTIIFDIQVKDGIIVDAMFRTDGCGATVACSSRLTRYLKGMTLEKARGLDNVWLEEDLGGLPEENKHCAVLAIDSLQEVLDKLPLLAGGKGPG